MWDEGVPCDTCGEIAYPAYKQGSPWCRDCERFCDVAPLVVQNGAAETADGPTWKEVREQGLGLCIHCYQWDNKANLTEHIVRPPREPGTKGRKGGSKRSALRETIGFGGLDADPHAEDRPPPSPDELVQPGDWELWSRWYTHRENCQHTREGPWRPILGAAGLFTGNERGRSSSGAQ